MPGEKDQEQETQLDIEALSADISEELFGQGSDKEPVEGAERTPVDAAVETAPPQPEEKTPEGVEPPATEQNSAEVQAVGAPETWSKEALQDWAAIPDRAKQEILKREQDIFKGIEQYREAAETGQAYSKVVEPYMPILAAENINPVEMFQNFAANHYLLSRGTPEQKVQLAAQLIGAYGVDLNGLLQYMGDYTPPDPATKALNDRIAGLEQQLQARTQQENSALQSQVDAEIAQFASDPANTYFQEVVKDMAAILQAGLAKDLKEAYDKAVFANPVTRQKEIERQTALNSQSEAEKAAELAKKKAVSQAADVTLSPKDRNGTIPLGSMDDTLAQTMDAIASR